MQSLEASMEAMEKKMDCVLKNQATILAILQKLTHEDVPAGDLFPIATIEELEIMESNIAKEVPKYAPSPLNENQFDSMKEICSVLDHFEAATLNTSSAKSTTVNLIIPTTLGLMIKLDSAFPVTQKPKTIRSDAIIKLRQYFEQQNASREADPLEYWKSSKIKTYIKTVASKQSLWRNA
ncbi:hypothetical protein ACLKA6_001122 [Drosophila palustris]